MTFEIRLVKGEEVTYHVGVSSPYGKDEVEGP